MSKHAVMQCSASEIQALAVAPNTPAQYADYLRGELDSAITDSSELNIPLTRYLFVVNMTTGRVQQWVD